MILQSLVQAFSVPQTDKERRKKEQTEKTASFSCRDVGLQAPQLALVSNSNHSVSAAMASNAPVLGPGNV